MKTLEINVQSPCQLRVPANPKFADTQASEITMGEFGNIAGNEDSIKAIQHSVTSNDLALPLAFTAFDVNNQNFLSAHEIVQCLLKRLNVRSSALGFPSESQILAVVRFFPRAVKSNLVIPIGEKGNVCAASFTRPHQHTMAMAVRFSSIKDAGWIQNEITFMLPLIIR